MGRILGLLIIAMSWACGEIPVPLTEVTETAVTIRWDTLGVPHIESDLESPESDAAAFYAWGWAQARWAAPRILSHLTMVSGTAAARFDDDLLGVIEPTAVPWTLTFDDEDLPTGLPATASLVDVDETMLFFGVPQNATVIVDTMPEAERGLLDAFARGVNDWVAGHRTELATNWPALDAHGIFDVELDAEALVRRDLYLFRWGSIAEMASTLARVDDAGGLALLELEASDYEGMSNQFGAGPDATSAGALLIGDPHIPMYDIPYSLLVGRIHSRSYDVVGGGLVGSAPITLGATREAAWSFTAAGPDNNDYYRVDLASSGDTFRSSRTMTFEPFATETNVIEVRDAASVTFTRRLTTHGVLVRAEPESGVALTWRSAHDGAFRIAEQLFAFNRAHSLDDLETALRTMNGVQGFNVLAAGRDELLYVDYASVPRRNDPELDYTGVLDGTIAGTDWNGLHSLDELPLTRSRDVLINCNVSPQITSDTIGERPVYMTGSREHLTSYRQMRIEERFAELAGVGAGDMQDISVDTKNLKWQEMLEVLYATVLLHGAPLFADMTAEETDFVITMITGLAAWDGFANAELIEPLYMMHYAEHLLEVAPQNPTVAAFVQGGRPTGMTVVESFDDARILIEGILDAFDSFEPRFGGLRELGEVQVATTRTGFFGTAGSNDSPRAVSTLTPNPGSGAEQRWAFGGQAFIYVAEIGATPEQTRFSYSKAVSQNFLAQDGPHNDDMTRLWAGREFTNASFQELTATEIESIDELIFEHEPIDFGL